MRASIAMAMAAAMAANASAFMAGPTPLGSMMRGRSLQLRSAETTRSAEARGPTMALALVTGARLEFDAVQRKSAKFAARVSWETCCKLEMMAQDDRDTGSSDH
eukprot:768792-Hanusia_phi.AAC.7